MSLSCYGALEIVGLLLLFYLLLRSIGKQYGNPGNQSWRKGRLRCEGFAEKNGFKREINKKLSYRRVTARCVLSVVILPITAQQCRNYLYDKSWPNRWYGVGGLVGGNVSWTNRRRSSCVYRLYTDDLLWRNFQSPQCRNCSRDPNHAHLGNTHLLQG